ncbi:MAG TPA: hypothetical protein PJ987_11625 [Bacteroidia bacterium]|nr:hypothetical protein [Bacteroidia bacterium]HMY42210.1 hypothetical protein [Chitinophagales bacterium]
MKKFRLYWLDGKTEIVEGDDIADAFSKAGYGAGAMKALDFYDNGELQSYEWNSVEKTWRMKTSHMEATSGC